MGIGDRNQDTEERDLGKQGSEKQRVHRKDKSEDGNPRPILARFLTERLTANRLFYWVIGLGPYPGNNYPP